MLLSLTSRTPGWAANFGRLGDWEVCVWAAEVWICRRREASISEYERGLAVWRGRRARRGLYGSAGVSRPKEVEVGEGVGVSREKCEEVDGRREK